MERSTRLGALVLGGVLAAMWAVELADIAIFNDGLDRHGIYPRRLSGVDGIVWAPFLHRGLGHLASNSLPFLFLGGLVLTEGIKRWTVVSASIVVGGGAMTWLLARPRIHLGASGIVFGYMGYLLASAYYRRSLRAVAIAVMVAVVYGGGLVIGLLPRGGVSWESHLFGLGAGVGVAFFARGNSERTRDQAIDLG